MNKASGAKDLGRPTAKKHDPVYTVAISPLATAIIYTSFDQNNHLLKSGLNDR